MNHKSKLKKLEKRLQVKEPQEIKVHILEEGDMEKFEQEAGIKPGMDEKEANRLLNKKYPNHIFVQYVGPGDKDKHES